MDEKASARSSQWVLLGILIVVVDLALVYYLRFVLGIDNGLVKSLLGEGIPFLVILCLYRARRYRARVEVDAEQGSPAEEDSPPPVVYLRSFKTDDKSVSTISLLRPETEEELLASLFNQIGPFLAIGKPHEELPTLGASRLYVDDGDWEEAVTDLMSRARLVVLRTGETEGLIWEASRAVKKVSPEKLLLVVPFGKKSYTTFRSKAQPFFPRPLPGYPAWKIPPTSLQGVIVFDSDWTARFLPFRAGLWRGSFGDPSRSWRMGLRPVYERLGIPWSLPPINWLRVVTFVFLMGVLLFGAFERVEERYRAPTPGELAYLHYVERVATSPELRLRLARSADTEPYVLARALTARGLKRLSDESIVFYVSLQRKLLESTSEKICALIVRNIASPREMGESLDKLSPAEMQSWLDFAELAALRELRQISTAPPLDARQLAEARGRLLQGIPQEVTQLVDTGRNFDWVGNKKICRAARVLFAKADGADNSLRPLLARAVVASFR